MILDSSAVVAILMKEPGAKKLAEKLAASNTTAIGAPTALEAAMVLTIKLRRDGQAVLNDFLQESGTQVTPFTRDHESTAMQAYLQYGKSRHPAQLNFGDCMSYAVAKLAGQPLLFVGDDFSQTDIARAS